MVRDLQSAVSTSDLMVLHTAGVEAGPALLQQIPVLLLRHLAASHLLLDLHLDDGGHLVTEDLGRQEGGVDGSAILDPTGSAIDLRNTQQDRNLISWHC